MRGLRGNVGYVGCVAAWIALVKLLRGLKYLLGGSTCYVGHNFYVGCVGQIYFCVGQFFYVGQHFLRELKISVRV